MNKALTTGRARLFARAALLLAAAALCALLAAPAGAWAVEAVIEGGDATSTSGELGTLASGDADAWYTEADADADTYTISNANELASFASIVNGTHATIDQDGFAGKTVQLSSNIALTSTTDFSCIGTEEHPFEGTFDGDENEIWTLRGFTLEVDSGSYLGIFGYVSDTGCLKNVSVNNASVTITAGESASDQDEPDVIEYVGVLVGYCAGSIENCSVSDATVNISTDQTATSDVPSVVNNVGGVAGAVDGDVTGCSFDGTIYLYVSTDPAEVDTGESNCVGMCIGGVVGKQGGEPLLTLDDGTEVFNIDHGDISGCSNEGDIYVTTMGTYWNERWYEYTTATVSYVAGVAGYSIGNISDCVNYGTIGYPLSSEGASSPSNGYTRRTGGIVGGWRELASADYTTTSEDYYGWFDNELGEENSTADEIVVTDCVNYGDINGFLGSGGIVGSADYKTLITRCVNYGDVTVFRWNKPQAGGITSSTCDDVSYCANFGEVASMSSSTGSYTSGYYMAGIVSMLNVYTAVDGTAGDTPVVSSCYNVGMIRTSGDYRQGAVVGSNEGTVQYCAYLEGCVPDASSRDYCTGGDDETSGAIISCYYYSASDLRTGVVPDDDTPSAIALINTLAPDNGWTTYFVPAADTSSDYPVLAGSGLECADPVDLSAASIELVENAVYSATIAPSPTVTVTLDGVELVQNVDFRVDPAEDATEVGGTYSASVVGIGNYTGTSIATVTYSIDKADLGDQVHQCTIVIDSVPFNWEVQYPDAEDVVVLDAGGGVIPADEYTISFPDDDEGDYQDAGTYNVTVTATDDSTNYEGSLTQAAFTIDKGALYSRVGFGTRPVAVLSTIVWGDDVRNWITTDEDGNKITGYLDNDEYVYTGEEIKPVAGVLTYLDVQLTLGVDYVNIYGNINAESDEVDGDDVDLINVTDPDDPVVLSVHYKSGSNFSNWINVAYYIVAADLADCTVTATDQPYTGDARDQAVTVSLNGHVLTEGVDYVVEYSDNVEPGTASYTVTALSQDEGGSGNLTGDAVSGTFEIVEGGGTVERIGGSNRYATAALEALEAFEEGCDTVILATGQNFPDSLAATSLAGALDAPILLTKAASLPDATSEAIEQLGATKVIIVGGTSAVSATVAEALEGDGLAVERISGDNRYATAEAIYTYGLTASDDGDSVWGDKVIIASGTNFADALSVSPLAYSQAYPIFLAGTNNGIEATLATSSRSLIRESGASEALIVGGTSAVSQTVVNQMGSIFGTDYVTRLAGDTRYETSAAIAEYAVSEGYLSWDRAAVASGTAFPDALAGSALQGRTGSVLLLVSSKNTASAAEMLGEYTGKIATIRILGGTSAVSSAVQTTLAGALGWATYNYEVVD